MRAPWLLLLAACGEVESPAIDAPPAADAPVADAAPDAPPACEPRTLLQGGAQVEPQGWSVVQQGEASLSLGPDFTRIVTNTANNATVGGQLLLNYPGSLPSPPFIVEVVLLVEQTDPHNQFDAGAAIMGSYTPPFGVGNDRSQMIYLDADSIGWADDSQRFQASVANNQFHTIELAVDASNAATVKFDGIAALQKQGYVTNNAMAIGDQTNDANVDSTLRIRSVRLLCP